MIAALCVLAAAPAAHAAFPGKNGKIVFADNPGNVYGIYTIDPDGTDVTRLIVVSGSGGAHGPTWSPDGSKIAFSNNSEIHTMNADGSGVAQVSHTGGTALQPSWSPDGAKIVFVSGGGIFVVNADGTGQTPLTNEAGIGIGGSNPVWSPDGSRIAFDRDGDVFVVNADGTGSTAGIRLTSDPDGGISPDWSPDASKILYWVRFPPSAPDEEQIFTINVDGTGETFVTNGVTPAWAPDGSKIVFGYSGISTSNADGSDATILHEFGRQPDWQPIPVNAYPRPKGASPMRVSLVTAYDQCAAPNRTHGPPLAFASCNPPAKTSAHLTVGTGDSNGKAARNEGYLRLRTIVGNPGTPADEADVAIDFFSDDVFNADLTDYTGELRAELPLRITDRDNTPHPGGPGAATTEDFTFHVDATCVAVADPQDGSSCQTTTTLEALMPGAIKEGRRSIWQLGQVVVYDGGADGDTATAGNTVFARQGVFIP